MDEEEASGDSTVASSQPSQEQNQQQQPLLFVYCSPYKRAKETWQIMQDNLHNIQIVGMREEPRIAEQQFGNFQVRSCYVTCCVCSSAAPCSCVVSRFFFLQILPYIESTQGSNGQGRTTDLWTILFSISQWRSGVGCLQSC